jgi:hypothetical protein
MAARPVYSVKTASPSKVAAPFLAQIQTNYEFVFTKKTPDEQKKRANRPGRSENKTSAQIGSSKKLRNSSRQAAIRKVNMWS